MLSIQNKTRQKVGKVAHFLSISDEIIGKKYDLSLVFIGNIKSRSLNKKYREKDYPTNVLSFPIDKDMGEIFINLDKVKTEAPDFDMKKDEFIFYLFVHGLLHLKGLDHGNKMEQLEDTYLRKYFKRKDK